MRLHGLHTLAAITAAAALSAPAPAAYALRVTASTGGGQPTPAKVQRHTGSSTDWALIGSGTAGGIAMLGAGLVITPAAVVGCVHRK